MSPLDSDQAERTEEQPNSSASGSESDKLNSGTVQITKEEWTSLKTELESLKRDAQSNKDRAVKKANERISEIEERIRPVLERAAPLLAKGSSVDEILADFDRSETDQAIREMALAWKSGNLPKTFSGNESAGVNVAAVVSEYDLSSDDPLVLAELQGKSFQSRTEVEAALARVLKKKASQPNPSTLHASSEPQEPKGEPGIEAKISKYQSDMLAARGNKSLLKAIKDKAIKDGVPVDTIVFV